MPRHPTRPLALSLALAAGLLGATGCKDKRPAEAAPATTHPAEPRPAEPRPIEHAVEHPPELPEPDEEAPLVIPTVDRADVKTPANAWRALPAIDGHGCADEDLLFDYGADGGMRNFFCRALTVFSWKTFLDLAPTAPFRAGPHKDGKLDLHNERDFGRYDPAFVRWAVDNLVPAAKDSKLRAETQPVYDRFVRKLARTYWEVYRAVWSDHAWREAERKHYLRAADEENVAFAGAGTDLYHDVLGSGDIGWGGYDPNHIRAATMWWLRRDSDGTADLWHEGLARLLETYDGPWWKAHLAAWSGQLPRRAAEKVPEYR